jgi:peptide/nickel transport system permease protein
MQQISVLAGRRIIAVVPVLFGASLVVFLLLYLAPGDAATTLLGPLASEEAKQILRQELGLNRPFLVQFGTWLWSVLGGDFGVSIAARRPVSDIVFSRFWNTLLLGGASLVVALAIGLPVGIYSASKPGSLFDRVASAVMSVIGAVPPFWLGLVLVAIFALKLRWLPATGMTSVTGTGGLTDLLWHLPLPTLATAAIPAAVITRMVRGAMLEILSTDYIQVARAKGISRRTILRRHALRNALPPIVTIVGLQLGYLIGGALFTEVVFAWPGLGQQLYSSIIARDVPMVQAAVLLIATSFVLINAFVDILNQLLDPQGRHG